MAKMSCGRRMGVLLAAVSVVVGMACRAGAATIRIMPMGDSITWGYDLAGYPGVTQTQGGYRTYLYNKLVAAGWDVEFCGSQTANNPANAPAGSTRHEGYSGYVSSNNYCPGYNGVLETIPTSFVSAGCKNPHIILLHIGTNDGTVGNRTEGYSGAQAIRDHGLQNLGLLVDKLSETQPGAEIVVSTLLFRDYGKNGSDHCYEAITNDFNPGLVGLVAAHRARGQKVHYFDLNPYVPAEDIPDGVHPNATGYEKMANGWFDCLTALVPNPAAFVPDDSLGIITSSIDDTGLSLAFNQELDEATALSAATYVAAGSCPGVASAAFTDGAARRTVRASFSGTFPAGGVGSVTVTGLKNAAQTATLSGRTFSYTAPSEAVNDAATVAGFRGKIEVDVSEDQTRTETHPVVQEAESKIMKTGKGTWRLPVAAFRQREAIDIGVRDGTLELTSGTMDAGVSKPTAILAQAALWISTKDDAGAASAGLVITNGAGGALFVSRWHDERETNTAQPTRNYLDPGWSTAQYTQLTGVPPTYEIKNGVPSVYFAGYTSGKFMQIRNAAGAAVTLQKIRDVFYVHGAFETYGYVLANTDTSTGNFNSYINAPGNMGNSGAFIWTANNIIPGPSRTGWTFLDGAYVRDPNSTTFAKGFHLFSVKSGRNDGALGGFFNNQRYQNRQGGDYLNEVVVFTNELTAVQRAHVTRWLQQKWNLRAPAGALKGRIEVAEGATLKLDGNSAGLTITGGGEVVKTGTGSALFTIAPDFRGRVKVEGGTAILPSAEAVEELPVAGETRTASFARAGATVNPATVGTSGVARFAAPSGETLVTTSGVGVATLAQDSGTLVLGLPKKTPFDALVSGTDPVFDNPDLEKGSPNAWTDIPNLSNCGWFDVAYSGGAANSRIWNDPAYDFQMQPYVCGGIHYLCLQGAPSYTYAKVTLPRAGVYELSFDGCGRQHYDRYMNTVMVGTSLEALQPLAKFKYQRRGPFARTFYRLPRFEAGELLVGVRIDTTGSMGRDAGGTLLDNFRLDYVASNEDPDVWKIPNGDFETLTAMTSAENKDSFLSVNNTAEHWTFDNPNVTASSLDPQAGVMVNGVLSKSGHNYFNVWKRDVGMVQLLLATTCGVARTTFRPPAGTWRLRGDAATCMMHWGDGSLDGIPTYQYNLQSDDIRARVAMSGVGTDLGEMRVTSQAPAENVWPNAFTVDGETDVTLELRLVNSQRATALLDNFVLVKVGGGETELVTNGSFEENMTTSTGSDWTSGGWRGQQNKGQQSTAYAHRTYPPSFYPAQVGSTMYDGSYCMVIVGPASIEQEITVPEAGLYRFSMGTANRVDLNYGDNPLKVTIRPEGAAVDTAREIATFVVNATNFVTRTALFKVATAGRYTLRIKGMWSTQSSDHLSRIDGVSVKKASDVPADAVPAIPAETDLNIAAGARLRLDFPGTLKVHRLRLGNMNRAGVISSATCPDYITGAGTLEVTPAGTMLIFR